MRFEQCVGDGQDASAWILLQLRHRFQRRYRYRFSVSYRSNFSSYP